VGRVGLGRFWGWDPKETVAFVSWIAYAAHLHARATAGWRTRRAAWINVAAGAAVVVNLFFVNLVVAGLHSPGTDRRRAPGLRSGDRGGGLTPAERGMRANSARAARAEVGRRDCPLVESCKGER